MARAPKPLIPTVPNGPASTPSYRESLWMVPVMFLATLIAYYRLAYPLLNDNDVPWHIAIGRLLVDTHHLPEHDIWAYGNDNHPWYILSWVWNLMLGIADRLFGELGVFIFSLSVAAGLVAATTARMLKLGIALPAVMLTAIMSALCMLDYVTARPQLAGYALAFSFYALMHKSRTDTGYRSLRWLPPLMALWPNTHGSFMVGFVIMGTYAVEAWFTKRFDWLKHIVIIGCLCAICLLINPYGPKVAIAAMVSFTSPATRYTSEWLPFNFGTSTGLSLWLIMFIFASNLRGARIFAADKILAMGTLIATMFSIRNGAFFILMSAPYLATCLDEVTRDLRKPQPESPLAKFMAKQSLKTVWAASAAILLILCLTAKALPHDDKIESEDFSANDAIQYALAHYPEHHFFSDYNLGGQIVYRTAGKLSYFMDSRASTAYDPEAVEEAMGFLKLTDGWQDRIKKRGLNGLIMAKGTNFGEAYEKGLYHDHWKLVFAGKRANVYIARP